MSTYCEYTMAITALADLLASRLTDNELAMLSAVLNQLGDTLATIAVHKQVCSDGKTKDEKQK
jgi:hypothetical protein